VPPKLLRLLPTKGRERHISVTGRASCLVIDAGHVGGVEKRQHLCASVSGLIQAISDKARRILATCPRPRSALVATPASNPGNCRLHRLFDLV